MLKKVSLGRVLLGKIFMVYFKHAGVAQLVECVLGKDEVDGSIPSISSIYDKFTRVRDKRNSCAVYNV